MIEMVVVGELPPLFRLLKIVKVTVNLFEFQKLFFTFAIHSPIFWQKNLSEKNLLPLMCIVAPWWACRNLNR